jgi:hypothetical protein
MGSAEMIAKINLLYAKFDLKCRIPMNWVHIIEAAIVASIAASFTDWYFFGVLFHDRYHQGGADVWRRYADKKDEVRSILLATMSQSITCFLFIPFCDYFRVTTLPHALELAGIVWLMLPVPILLSYAIFIRMHRLIIVSHSLGWLVRLAICAFCVAWLL